MKKTNQEVTEFEADTESKEENREKQKSKFMINYRF